MDKDSRIIEYISETVLANKGVNKFASGIVDSITGIIGISKEPAGIKLDRTELGLKVDLKLIVNFGINIPQLSYDIQSELKSGLEQLANEKIDSINIIVEGVRDNE